ncbi:serine/threonine-protein kinase [Pseudonocardia sp. CA-107938]|uniref:serine/threonine-protein kinase n=1 Tax=Pseudonocardia sp. CA-107938 TaxID=3240021 RepID=UPI003D8B1784
MAESDERTLIGGRYRLDERIASGAMGAVWRGTDQLLNRTVAIKELLAAAAPSTTAGGRDALEESRQRIHREGRIAARLQHAHVIRMFDVVVHDDRPWLVMEYLESKSLSAVIATQGTLDPLAAAAIGRDVADGLAAAHAAGVIHRDVKPGNVLIGDDGRTKLTDFGVSRAVDDVQITRTGLIAGTPAFLAPEVARGADPAPAADVFALGATIYAAIEGHPPFGLNENAYALLHKVATGVIDPPKRTGPLTGIVLRLLDPDPEKRPTAMEARDELAAVVRTGLATSGPDTLQVDSRRPLAAPAPAGPPTLAAPALVPSAPTPGRSRRRFRVAATVAAGVVAAGGIATAIVLASNGGQQPAGQPQAAAPSPAISTSAPSATSATSAPTTSGAVTPVPADSAVAFMQNYYGLLPGNTDAAWAQLSPSAQNASGGRAAFNNFYGGLSRVWLEQIRHEPDGSVTAFVVFTKLDGSVSREPYRFVVGVGPDGRQVLQSFEKTSPSS